MKKKAAINVSVGGQDCSGNGKWTPEELRIVSQLFWAAAEALEQKEHGAFQDRRELAHIGIDFGGPFDEENGLPVFRVRCFETKGGGGRVCREELGHKGPHVYECGAHHLYERPKEDSGIDG